MYIYITNTHTYMIPMHICLTVFINLVSMCLLSPSSLPILTSPNYKFFHSFPPKTRTNFATHQSVSKTHQSFPI